MQRILTLTAAAAVIYAATRPSVEDLAKDSAKKLKILQYKVEEPTMQQGGGDDKKKAVLIHGWPDNIELWAVTRKFLLNKGYRVVSISLPNYEDRPESTKPMYGYSFEEAATLILNTIKDADAMGGVLIAHDWGTIIASMMQKLYPEEKICSKFISLDIGSVPQSEIKVGTVLFGFLYQGLNNLAYSLGNQYGGSLVHEFTAKYVCGWTPYPGAPKTLHVSMTWPYRRLWADLFFNGGNFYKKHMDGFIPRNDVAFMFIYGSDKADYQKIFTEQWMKKMTSGNALSRAVSVKGDHWFMVKENDEYLKAIAAFLENSPSNL